MASLLSGEFGLKNPRTINHVEQPPTRTAVQPINKPNIIDHPPNPMHMRINSGPVINHSAVKPRNRPGNNSWNPKKQSDVFRKLKINKYSPFQKCSFKRTTRPNLALASPKAIKMYIPITPSSSQSPRTLLDRN